MASEKKNNSTGKQDIKPSRAANKTKTNPVVGSPVGTTQGLSFTQTDLKALYQLALEASDSHSHEADIINNDTTNDTKNDTTNELEAKTELSLANKTLPDAHPVEVNKQEDSTSTLTLAPKHDDVALQPVPEATEASTEQLTPLGQMIRDFNLWKLNVVECIEAYNQWLADKPQDKKRQQAMDHALSLFVADRIRVVVVGEFSRGKSEFINALLAQKGKQRLFPTRVGRTTMCPVEIYTDSTTPPYLKLLPIQTRESGKSVRFFRQQPEAWFHHDLAVDDADAMKLVLREVARTIEVKDIEAQQLGFNLEYLEASIGKEGFVHIPAWRHALINFPHELLQAGVSIVDTPGINAPGLETDLTSDVLADAHGLLYLLSVETGVTSSDFAMWHKTIAPVARDHQVALMAVLNKIDLLENDEEPIVNSIERLIRMTAKQLKIAQRQIIPMSAKYALKSGLEGDALGLKRSGFSGLAERVVGQILKTRQQLLKHVILKRVQLLIADSILHLSKIETNTAAESILAFHENVAVIDSIDDHRLALTTVEDKHKEATSYIYKLRPPFVALYSNIEKYISKTRYDTHRMQASTLLHQPDTTEALAVKNAMGMMLSLLKADLSKMKSQIQQPSTGLDAMLKHLGINYAVVPTQSIEDIEQIIQGIEHRYCTAEGVAPINTIAEAEKEFFPKIDWMYGQFLTSLSDHQLKIEAHLVQIKKRYSTREAELRQVLNVRENAIYKNKDEDKAFLESLRNQLRTYMDK